VRRAIFGKFKRGDDSGRENDCKRQMCGGVHYRSFLNRLDGCNWGVGAKMAHNVEKTLAYFHLRARS